MSRFVDPACINGWWVDENQLSSGSKKVVCLALSLLFGDSIKDYLQLRGGCNGLYGGRKRRVTVYDVCCTEGLDEFGIFRRSGGDDGRKSGELGELYN